jgi:hypothetical protein
MKKEDLPRKSKDLPTRQVDPPLKAEGLLRGQVDLPMAEGLPQVDLPMMKEDLP